MALTYNDTMDNNNNNIDRTFEFKTVTDEDKTI
jgi:hypothetical protein